ncbi:LPP20 family lipoprotein [Bacteroides ovatus]|nr:LPP20 family lipoprotein [Bacteroides ovatus]
MAEISEGDYQQKAKQNALSDLVSEIQVVIAANSLLNTLEDDGNVKQTFAESIRTEARAEIENFRLVDSWRSDNEYWVYYELNKGDYAVPWWKHVVRRQSVTDSIFGIRDTLLYNREI